MTVQASASPVCGSSSSEPALLQRQRRRRDRGHGGRDDRDAGEVGGVPAADAGGGEGRAEVGRVPGQEDRDHDDDPRQDPRVGGAPAGRRDRPASAAAHVVSMAPDAIGRDRVARGAGLLVSPPVPRRPDFFILGAPKCGTTALSEYLRQHPRVFVSRPKEPHYFCADFDYYYAPGQRSEEHYLRLFAEAGRGPPRGGRGVGLVPLLRGRRAQHRGVRPRGARHRDGARPGRAGPLAALAAALHARRGPPGHGRGLGAPGGPARAARTCPPRRGCRSSSSTATRRGWGRS